MSFIKQSLSRIRSDGYDGLKDTTYQLYRVGWDRLSKLENSGTNVFEKEWDVLIILDGCRYDTFQEIVSDNTINGFNDECIRRFRSVGSNSEEWLENTFTANYQRYIKNTIYVTGNPFSEYYLDDDQFAILDEVWKSSWDKNIGTIRAEPITDHAIYNWRNETPSKMIVHYMQPHFPCVPNPKFNSGINIDRIGKSWESVWDMLRKGEADKEEVYELYSQNLKYVLDSVNKLTQNIDAQNIVITADHGNSFGSWGLYGHPRAPIADIRDVPWYRTSGNDIADYEPKLDYKRRGKIQSSIEEKLSDLGYL